MSNNTDSTSSLLNELLALQNLFDDQDDIPILDEPLQVTAITSPAIKPENPFLPKAMLERLNIERTAAQSSAEEAQRTMQRVFERKQEQARQSLSGIGKGLSTEHKDALIDELVAEMLPQIAQRLRDRLKIMLSR
ncbi:MAG TPA: hypothetical protein VL020_06335 [Pseudomonadales bacterium]|nr:hypothetical protein [Pseudomonadales bacterium]